MYTTVFWERVVQYLYCSKDKWERKKNTFCIAYQTERDHKREILCRSDNRERDFTVNDTETKRENK